MDQQQAAAQFNAFVDDLINQKFAEHQDELTPEVKEELRQDIFMRLDEFVMARIIAALSDEDVHKLEELMKEGKTREDVQKFAAEHVPDFTTFLTNAILEFRAVYLETA